ncbi:MAG: S8 family serine peptidase [Gammaproteobacteria bacterium]|nr:S8 family serine peptidase [Gammaproteobacteria bacterium]MDE2347553.1 S8 family serine peptidase [Gammaproteobacteria bacterium]
MQIRRLIRAHRRLIEADPAGEPIVRDEILASFPTPDALTRALALGFAVESEQELHSLDLRIVVLRIPARRSTRAALNELRAAVPEATLDYDHIYLRGGEAPTAAPVSASQMPPTTGAAPHSRIRVGLVDSGVNATEPAFRDSTVHPWGCGGTAQPGAHGTAVASLLVRRARADLYAADVYCGQPTGGSVDAIVAALAWLAQNRVPVINISLVGPKNLLLAQVVAALLARGYVIVAAVGNDGPAAPPLYPAAYPQVVGVTAVDAERRVLLEAERGPQVTFAAQGAGLEAANLRQGSTLVRGTSFAAPTVAALFAARMSAPDPAAAAAALAALIRRAVDLGPTGRDPIYGYGLLGAK